MTNLTISLNEAITRKARVRAIHESTSVSAKVREFLAQYVQEPVGKSVGQAFLDHAVRSKANSQAALWSRDDAYDRSYPGAKA